MLKKVWIDAGHGGTDSGAVANGLKEKDMTLVVSLACKAELQRYGVIVGMTREKDRTVDLNARDDLANNWGADLFVSNHFNAGGGDGVEVYHSISSSNGKRLAQNVHDTIVNELGQNSRGIKTRVGKDGKDYYAVIRTTKMPAIITETAFIDSNDRFIADTVEEQKRIGVVIAHGILEYLNINYNSGGITMPNQNSNTPSSWAKASWDWGKKKGICDGTRPQATITREEVVAMLNKFENSMK
jgi:N-acetylmuramoyl-L-alanine amidase